MIRHAFFSAVVAILMSFCQGSSAHAAAPEEQLIEAVKVALGKKFNTDWSVLDALPGIKWAPLPPRQQAINTKRKDLTLSRLASSRD
jgi:hypothetical protein